MSVDAVKEWTVMVYFAGDNNLNLEMAYALEQIEKIVNPNLNLYVYFDGSSSNVPTLYCDFSVPENRVKLYRSVGIEDKLIKNERRSGQDHNENSAYVNNILNFVDWCVKKDKKAEAESGSSWEDKKYAFIFSGHSFGFLDWGLFKDEKADYTMTLSKLKWLFERITFKHEKLVELAENMQAKQKADAEKRGYQFKPWSEAKLAERTTEIIGRPLSILGFDSCVMSTLEIGSQFKGLAETMVASEGSVPNAGWNYAQILLEKLKGPNSNAKQIAAGFVEGFIKHQNKFALADISVDMAAWDLLALPELEKQFGELAANLKRCFDEVDSSCYNHTRRILTQAHYECQTYLYEQHVDLGDFCQLLIKEIDSLKADLDESRIAPIVMVGESCRKVLSSLKKCVLLTGYSGTDFQFSNGISLFFPWSLAAYHSAQKDYLKLSFIRHHEAGQNWRAFLEKYLGEVTFRKSKALTPTDAKGKPIISRETKSVVYKTYDFFDDQALNPESKQPPDGTKQPPDGTKQPPDGTKQPPDGTKQPPDGTRQPPDGTKLFGNMSIFLSRFMKLKNFQSNWNQAGFTSESLTFVSQPDSESAENRPLQNAVVIEPATPIEKILDDLRLRLDSLREQTGNRLDYEKFREIIDNMSQNADQPETVELLGGWTKSNPFETYGEDEDVNENVKKNLLKSISSLGDSSLKNELSKNLLKENTEE